VKQGYRLIIVDKDGVLVSEFQLTENALAQPEAFVAALKQSIKTSKKRNPEGKTSVLVAGHAHPSPGCAVLQAGSRLA